MHNTTIGPELQLISSAVPGQEDVQLQNAFHAQKQRLIDHSQTSVFYKVQN